MSTLDTLIRLARFKAEALQRELASLEERRRAHEARIAAHERAILDEQKAVRADPETLPAYAGFARAAIAKRANLAAERERLAQESETLRAVLSDAFIELKKVETLSEQALERANDEAGRKDRVAMDDVATTMMRRKK